MGDMPYMVQKGPIWTFFDDWFSDKSPATRRKNKIDALVDVHTKKTFEEAGPTAPSGGSGLVAEWPASFDKATAKLENMNPSHFADWFQPNAPAFADCSSISNTWTSPLPTPWWNGWAGNAESIVREAFIRAIEVSLGLTHQGWLYGTKPTLEPGDVYTAYGLDPTDPYKISDGSRNWAMEFWWICPLPWLQTSITWREVSTQPTDGIVTVMFLTPGPDSAKAGALLSDLLEDPASTGAPKSQPTDASTTRGSWISSHRYTKTGIPKLHEGTELGKLVARVFAPTKFSCGEVVTVSPDPNFGGVK